MSNRALVFTGGKSPSAGFDRSIIPPCGLVCAADSGLDTAVSMGYAVDTAIGDFDSLDNHGLLEHVAHVRLPRDKDVTDTEAVLQLIHAQGFTRYVLIGGGEGRFDHLLHLYGLFATYGAPELWITAQECLYLVEHDITLEHMSRRTLSVLPAFFHGSSKAYADNLVWELDGYPINMYSQSISNRCAAETLSLHVEGDPVFLAIPFH
jgi:thiamine pyrophosphokinase